MVRLLTLLSAMRWSGTVPARLRQAHLDQSCRRRPSIAPQLKRPGMTVGHKTFRSVPTAVRFGTLTMILGARDGTWPWSSSGHRLIVEMTRRLKLYKGLTSKASCKINQVTTVMVALNYAAIQAALVGLGLMTAEKHHIVFKNK